MNDSRARQARFNAESRDQWSGFADHRRQVSTLLAATAEPGLTRLCVLGAGNSNDLDLVALLTAHREVHLVDLDREALDRGADRQGVTDRESLHRHGGLDLTAMIDVIENWSPSTPITDPDLDALVEWPARRLRLAIPGPFDLVASTCMLSQIVGNAFVAVGEAHDRFPDLVRAIRLGHLRLLTSLAKAGGQVVLITDLVSSDSFPSLGDYEEADLVNLLPSLARDQGLIHGVRPAEIVTLFRRDRILSRRVTGLEAVAPWRWKLHDRVYLVWAVIARMAPTR